MSKNEYADNLKETGRLVLAMPKILIAGFIMRDDDGNRIVPLWKAVGAVIISLVTLIPMMVWIGWAIPLIIGFLIIMAILKGLFNTLNKTS